MKTSELGIFFFKRSLTKNLIPLIDIAIFRLSTSFGGVLVVYGFKELLGLGGL